MAPHDNEFVAPRMLWQTDVELQANNAPAVGPFMALCTNEFVAPRRNESVALHTVSRVQPNSTVSGLCRT